MKSSRESVALSEQLLSALLERLPSVTLRNKSVTTSSIYCKTPDGYSLRIGDHKGREKYSYKWNLGPQYTEKGQWRKEWSDIDKRDYWRFYTSSVETLARAIEKNMRWQQSGSTSEN